MTVTLRRITSVAGATALAAGAAYGVAIDHADSSAAATRAGHTAHAGRPPGPDLGALASKLGVSTARLRAALDATRPPGGRLPPDRMQKDSAGLAKALGVTQSALQAALDKAPKPPRPIGPPDGPPPAGPRGTPPGLAALTASVAKSLGIDEAKVRAAFADVHRRHEAPHRTGERRMAAALAKQLGLSTSKVQTALDSMRPR